jgi:hypothetical protein
LHTAIFGELGGREEAMMVENHVGMNGDYEEDEDFAECGRFSLLDSLARRDPQGRALILDRFERALTRWREQSAGPEPGETEGESAAEARKLLTDHLWTALALRWNAPFPDIRARMSQLLEAAKVSYDLTPDRRRVGVV